MNLKELILFGMEESQEPVIKNPILQAALREPRPMTQGGPVGNPTGMITEYGRKVYETPGGEKVSEKSVTLQMGDTWINVPSIHGGKMYNQAQLEQMLINGKIQPTSTHNSEQEAVDAAMSRSDMMQSERLGFQSGQLVDHGPGRQGYNGKETRAETQARYAKKHGISKIRQLADGTWVWHSTRGPLYAPTKTALKKKMASPKADWMAGILRRQKANTAALNLARDNVDQWTKDWFTKNLNEYGIRDLDKSLNQLTKDWKVEVKANPAKYTHSNFTGIAETGFPKIRGATKIQGTGKAKKIVPNPKAFKFPGVGSLGEGRGGDKYHRPFFKKVFYANYLNNNPTFKTDVKNYMKYILENKSGQVNQHNAKAFREFGEKIAKPDVIHFLSPDAGINTVSRSKLLGTAFPGLYQKFQNKVNSASIRYTENLKKVERKLKIGSIKKSMVAEQEALAKIFDVSELPQSLRYSADHQFGIAEAAKSKDLKFVQATVDNLRGMTVAMNEGLGWGGFSLQRKALTNEINAGRQVTENLEKLNKITKAAYNVDGAYQLSPKNKVIPAAHFVGESQPERFASYFKEISKTKEGSAAIKKQYGNLDNLLKTAKNVKGSGKVKAVASMIAILGSGKLADKLLKENGISLTQDENEKILEASMLPTELIQEHPVTSTLGAAATLRASKSVKGDPLKKVRRLHKLVSTPLKKFIRTAGTPLAGAGFAGWQIHDNLKSGESVADAVVDPLVGAELAFPSLFKENLSKIIPDKYKGKLAKAGRKVLGLGKVGSRFMGPVGIGIGAVGSVYDAYKDYERRKEFITPETITKAQQEQFDANQPMFNEGGRVGLAKGSKGPKDPSKRLFIKGVAAASMIPILGKYFKLAKPAAKAVGQYTGPVIEKIKGLEWVQFLAKRLWDEGADVTETAARQEREIVRRGTLESGDDVDMVYNLDSGDVRFEVSPVKGSHQTSGGAYNDPYSLDYKAPQVIDEGKQAGTKIKSEIEVAESRPVQTDPETVELDGDYASVDDAFSDLTELEAFAKKKLTKEIHKAKGTKPKNVTPEYDPPDYPDIDDFASGGRVSYFDGGIVGLKKKW